MRPSRPFGAAVAFALVAGLMPAVVAAVMPPQDTIVWPLPQQQRVGTAVLRLDPMTFKFTSSGATSSTVAAAFERYRAICFTASGDAFPPAPIGAAPVTSGAHAAGQPSAVLASLELRIGSADERLGLNVSERYALTVAAPVAVLQADTVWGALRGLETFSQLLQHNGTTAADVTVREQQIQDWPRFPVRAVMVDTARHFLPVPLLRANIDAMAYNKLNVMHWHMTDTASFPYTSTAYPELASKGAFDARHTYSKVDVAGLVEYARLRGVRVLPEFDSPGHCFPSWGKGGPPDLLTSCGSKGGVGPLRPDLNSTYVFLQRLFQEVADDFATSSIFHAGGDEVSTACWEANAEVIAWMASRGMNATQLLSHYMQRLFRIVEELELTPMVWRPGSADVVPLQLLPPNTIFDVYSGPLSNRLPPDGQGGYNVSAAATTAAGFRVVRSAGYYLDQLCDPDPGSHAGTYWGYWGGWKYYARDPTDFVGGRPELVLGGKAQM